MKTRLFAACSAILLCGASAPASQEYRNLSIGEYSRLVASAIHLTPGKYAFVSRMVGYDIKSLPNDSSTAAAVLTIMRRKLAAGPSVSGNLCLASAAGAGINTPLNPSACRVDLVKINENVVDTTLSCKANAGLPAFRLVTRSTYRDEGYSFRGTTTTSVMADKRLHPATMTAAGEAHRVGGC